MRQLKLFLKKSLQKGLIKINQGIPKNFKIKSCDESSVRCLKNWRAEGYSYHKKGLDAPSCCIGHLERMLKEIVGLLESNGLEYYLTYGTYLGARRHGSIIPWDTDVDLACTADLNELKKVLLNSKHHVVVENENLIRVNLSMINDLHIDIEIWSNNGKESCFCDDIYVGTRTMSNDKIYPLRKLYIGDSQYSCPGSDDWLFEVYGRDCLHVVSKKYNIS